jgi:hypothetical protein
MRIRTIKKNAGKLDDPQNLQIYGIFYIGLNDDTFYWEILVMNIRKFFIIITATFITSSNNSYKGYLGILAMLMQRHLSHYKQPFIDQRFNNIEIISSLASVNILKF